MISQNFVEDEGQSLFSRLQSIVPTTDNRHMTSCFLLDAESHVRLPLPSDRPFLDGPTIADPASLTIAKLALKGVLNPAWHPTLEEYERQMSSSTNGFEDSQMFHLCVFPRALRCT